ncbi:hypothetical protein CHU98_g7443 [Xylaria longipes]|nr:hypothetical protein CHU98_g7443 [Xylaria longipes]
MEQINEFQPDYDPDSGGEEHDSGNESAGETSPRDIFVDDIDVTSTRKELMRNAKDNGFELIKYQDAKYERQEHPQVFMSPQERAVRLTYGTPYEFQCQDGLSERHREVDNRGNPHARESNGCDFVSNKGQIVRGEVGRAVLGLETWESAETLKADVPKLLEAYHKRTDTVKPIVPELGILPELDNTDKKQQKQVRSALRIDEHSEYKSSYVSATMACIVIYSMLHGTVGHEKLKWTPIRSVSRVDSEVNWGSDGEGTVSHVMMTVHVRVNDRYILMRQSVKEEAKCEAPDAKVLYYDTAEGNPMCPVDLNNDPRRMNFRDIVVDESVKPFRLRQPKYVHRRQEEFCRTNPPPIGISRSYLPRNLGLGGLVAWRYFEMAACQSLGEPDMSGGVREEALPNESSFTRDLVFQEANNDFLNKTFSDQQESFDAGDMDSLLNSEYDSTSSHGCWLANMPATCVTTRLVSQPDVCRT